MQNRMMLNIVAPTLLVSIVLMTLGATAAWYVHQEQQDSAVVLSTTVTKVAAAEELVMICHELRYELGEYLETGDRSHLAAAAALQEQANRLIAQCETLAADETESRVVQRFKSGYQRFYVTFASLVTAEPPPNYRELVSDLVRGVVTREILDPVVTYLKMIRAAMIEAVRRDRELADRMGLGLLVLGTCGAVGGLVAGFGVARGIQRSIVQLSIPIHDAAGRLNSAVGPIEVPADNFGALEETMRVVADRVSAVIEDLNTSQAIARRAERLASLGQLAAGMAHELRNPLTSMKIIVQTASDAGQVTALDERDFAILSEEITRLETTIQSFLDYARPPGVVKRPTVACEELDRTVSLVAHRADQMGISINREIPDVPVTLHADPAQLRQVMLNLLLNAIEASPEGGEVTVRLSHQPQRPGKTGDIERAAEWLRIDVEDCGPGLSMQQRDRIFEPFFTTKDCGTGLGLAICKRIVDDHGGEITADNRPEGGARFTVKLPVRDRNNGTAKLDLATGTDHE